jgi:hypothetical protein
MDAIGPYADEIVGRSWQAAEEFRLLDQDRTDRIVDAVFEAAWDARHELARLAFEATGMGVLEHKVLKNAYASLLVYEDIRPLKTVGVISQNQATGITEIAQPKGPILAMVPVTNPTATTIFKTLISMKTRNPVIFSPHRAARRSIHAARMLAEAALGPARAPRDPVDDPFATGASRRRDAPPEAGADPRHRHELDRPDGAFSGTPTSASGPATCPSTCTRQPTCRSPRV